MLVVCSLFFFAGNAQVKIGDNPTTIDNASLLELESTTKGLVLPRMTTAQRGALVTPLEGMLIYNLDLDCIQANIGTDAAPDWQCMTVGATQCAACVATSTTLPASPVVGEQYFATDDGCIYTYNGSAWTSVCPGSSSSPSTNGTAVASGYGTAAGCSAPAFSATLTQGVSAAGTTMTIQANVTTLGTYNITSGPVNGVTWSGSGTFTATGCQDIVLTASGTPTASGATNYPTNTSPSETGTATVAASAADADGDGIPDASDSDPSDPCLPAQSAGYTGYNSSNSTWANADCDGDGFTNGAEVAAGSDPYNNTSAPAGTATLTCASAAFNPTTFTQSSSYTGTLTIPYTAGNGGTYTAQSVASTGVTGLTASLAAGSFASGAGSLVYNITDTPASSGTATFAIAIGGSTCTITATVAAASTTITGYTGAPTVCATATISATPCSSVSGATANDDAGTTLGTEYNWTGATTSGMANTNTTRAIVDISGQCWMRYNMDAAPSSGSSWYYTGGPHTNEGRLYNWAGAMNNSTTERAQGVCPTGWHVPSDCEWMYLENNLGMSTANQGTTGSRTSGTVGSDLSTATSSGNNNSGFTALLAGYRSSGGTFGTRGTIGNWWSSSEASASNAFSRAINSSQTGVGRYSNNKANGYSVRCLKD